MKRRFALFLLFGLPLPAAEPHAQNVILFLGDAGGIPTLNAASLHGYNHPHKLFVQSMPSMALMETSSASRWVTDSAAGMTAIVTGHKTHNGVISQSGAAVRGKQDGEPLKTILEHAEERGLATGVVSNSSMASATPAACYAHVNDRKLVGEIFAQVLKPRFGDGVDVVIGPGRKEIVQSTARLGLDLATALPARGLPLYDSLKAIPAGARRAVVLLDSDDFDLGEATDRAIEILSRNPKGFFLMVESDIHMNNVMRGLERTLAFDGLIQRVARRALARNTLILFTADHSYDFRLHDGRKGEPLVSDKEKSSLPEEIEGSLKLANIRVDDDHTGEQVLVAAQGPGAERVRGFLANTDLFHIMMAAYGWGASPAGKTPTGRARPASR